MHNQTVKQKPHTRFSLRTNFFKNTSLRFLQVYEQLKPHFGKVKNKNAFFFKIRLSLLTMLIRTIEPIFYGKVKNI